MSFLGGRLASTEGAFFLQESKNAVVKLAGKLPPSPAAGSSRRPPDQGGEAAADVLPEVLRHSLPSAVFAPPADSSLATSSKWVIPGSPNSAGFVSADAKNPLRAFVSLPQVTFGPKRWELPTVENSILASTANDLRRERHPTINPANVKAAAEGLAHIGKAFALATTFVFGGAALAFVITASKLELQKVDDIKVKGKEILQPQIELIKDQVAPLRIWTMDGLQRFSNGMRAIRVFGRTSKKVENTSKKWRPEGGVEERKEKPAILKELSKTLSFETKQ